MATVNWLPWLEDNDGMLGFGESAARKIMAGARNQELTTDLDNAGAIQLSREMWGHAPKKLSKPTGDPSRVRPMSQTDDIGPEAFGLSRV